MELKEIEPRNQTDKIVESLSEANADENDNAKPEADIDTGRLNQPILEIEAEVMLNPEPINRPIPAPDRESIYEEPYSTRIYHNYGGSRISFGNSSNDQSGKAKWSLSCLIIGLIIGLVIGATVTGLSLHSLKTPMCATSPTLSPMLTATPSNSTEVYGESNFLFIIYAS